MDEVNYYDKFDQIYIDTWFTHYFKKNSFIYYYWNFNLFIKNLGEENIISLYLLILSFS